MVSDQAEECPKCKAGAPAWVMTFADLMSLLMCFFVLLLSFATMDVNRFKRMAESMKDAFGVQREIPAYETVKGTSVIAQHFSPAIVEPSPIEEIRQSTTQERQNLDIPESTREMDREEMEARLEAERQKELEAETKKIRESLLDEILAGKISVEMENRRIVIRIHEKGSFPSGSAVLNAGFGKSMKKIVEVVKHSRGKIIVAGHTDDVPIRTEWYRSNWELSSARAVSMAHELLRGGVDPGRMVVSGYADTQPLVPNSNAKNRAKNRRVEIILMQDEAEGGTFDEFGP